MKVYNVIYRNYTGENITFQWLRTTKFMINYCEYLHLFHMNRYNWINDKWLNLPLVLNVCIRTHLPYAHTFHAHSYDSTYGGNFAPAYQLRQKKRMKINFLDIYIQALFMPIIHLYILILFNIRRKFVPACQLLQKIFYEKKLSQSTQLHTRRLHTLLYNSAYDNISAPDWINSKIDSINSYHFPPWSNYTQVNSNKNSIFLWTCTCY